LALFWGWAEDGRPIVIEVQSPTDVVAGPSLSHCIILQEYDYGHPVEKRTWNYNWFNYFTLLRNKKWA